VRTLEEEIKNFGRGKKPVDASQVLPIEPAKHSLVGHRDQVICLTFHPVFNSLVSGGEDCTIKVWDSESGKF
jgi:platelet-activating factor acetylhydrolase IB subunit alpha